MDPNLDISKIFSDVSTSAREPLVDKILKLERRVKALEAGLLTVLSDKYCAEFEVIDGLNRHRLGLTFNEWLTNENWKLKPNSLKRLK